MKITVIVPTLNEEGLMEQVLGQFGPPGSAGSDGPDVEVIVADGGSIDRTVGVAEGLGAEVVVTAPGRGAQMDRAARSATGDILLFLHADTMLPGGWKEAVERAMARPGVVAGAFRLSIGAPGPWFRVVEFVARQRARFLGLVFGDQALFVRRDVFFSIGGFRGLPLMEDVDCVKRLRKEGVVALLEERVITSPRRWTRGGRLKNTLKNWLFLLLYRAGLPPARLYKWYYR